MNDNSFEQLKKNIAHHYRHLYRLQELHMRETGKRFPTCTVGPEKIPHYRKDCEIYTHEDMPDVEVHYKIVNDVDVCDITVNGQNVSDPFYDMIYASRSWEYEIEKHLELKAKDDREDCIIESFLVSRSDAFDCLRVRRQA